MRLAYAIKYVADMDAAVAFHRDILGLALKFQSPFWSEFATGETSLALHAASDDHPAGSCQLGFNTPDIDAAYAERAANGLTFSKAPETLHGSRIARILGSEGEECSLGQG